MPQTLFFPVVLCAGITFLSGCVLPTINLGPLQALPQQAARTPPAMPVPLRLETSDGRACNGVRLDATIVATAAHCVHQGGSVTLVENGLATRAAGVVENPGFALQPLETAAGADLAKLTAPTLGTVAPVALGPIQPGEAYIISLTQSGELQETACTYLGRSGPLVELSCRVELGWSGAPVVQNGVLVGIVSARGSGAAQSVVQMADAIRLSSF